MSIATASAAQEVTIEQPEIKENPILIEDGFKVGSMLVTPGMAVTAEYDTNLFATRTNEIDDWLLILQPSVGISSQWQQHKLDMNAGAAIQRYDRYDSEDVEDYWFNLSGQLDYSSSGKIFGGAAYSREHEDRGSPETVLSGSEPTVFDSTRGHLGLNQSFGKWMMRVGGTAEALTFDDAEPIQNSDRDRDLFGAGLRATYRFNSQFAAYAQGIWDKREYDSQPDDFGFERDSDGYRAGAGVETRISNRLHADAYLGYIRQRYDDPRFNNVGKPDVAASLKYLTGPLSSVNLQLARSLEETTLPMSAGYLSTVYSMSAQRRFSQRLSGSFGASFTDIDYGDIDRDDDFYGASVTADYAITRNVHLQASYRYLARDSSAELEVGNPANRQYPEDYAKQRFSLTLATDLYPVRAPAYSTLKETAGSEAGVIWNVYFGAAATHEAISLKNSGARDEGTDQAQRADLDGTSTGFVGLEAVFGNWRLGVEAGRTNGGATISEEKAKDSARTLKYEVDKSTAVSLLAGRRISNAGWLTIGVGAVETDFEVDYQINNAPESAVKRTDTEDGTRWSIGTQADVGTRAFVRLDHSMTRYDNFTADLETETEDFRPTLVSTSMGVGWRLSSVKPRTEISVPERIISNKRWLIHGGFEVGHSILTSELSGTHIDGGQGGNATPSNFDASFGNHGGALSGAFLGGDIVIGQFRLGLEGEYAGNHASWDHIRAPTGRTFGVELKEETAYSMRLGYALASGTVVYVRAGEARARFLTTWKKGENRSNDIERDDRKRGDRWGVGMDLPLGSHGLLRSEYTYTRYDDISFTSSHGGADDMKFENDIAVFRLGIGAQF